MQRYLLPFLLMLFLSVSSGCADIITIHSANEPANDAEALQLVHLSNAPVSAVTFRAFQAGLDDNMRMVITMPSQEFDTFWNNSPWRAEPCVEHNLDTSQADGGTPVILGLPDGPEPTWHAWTTARRGCIGRASLPDAQRTIIFVTHTDDPEHAVGYIFWHQT